MNDDRQTFSVRPARVEDREEMLALFPRLAAFDVPESRIPEHLWVHDAAMLELWAAGDKDDCLVHVAVDASETIVGVAMATLRPELLSKEPSSHLEAIAVAEGLSGKGIGGMLLAAVEKDARSRGAGTMTLHVFATNARARGFYEGKGYHGELMRYIKPLRA
ncbi:MAG: GNAT family N-acetyltransferase [Woeseiaceae bacterium]|nr:GNAT family N-acetyltransferase [Woeseiaceae bacterium]